MHSDMNTKTSSNGSGKVRRRHRRVRSVSRIGVPASSAPTTLDLFCGAGGITEGFRRAGFQALYGNDCMAEAIETFRLNHPTTWADTRPIQSVDAASVRRALGLDTGALDVLVGGPPCQSFSINAPKRSADDPRNNLFKDFIRFVKEFRPKVLLFENVPGLLSFSGRAVFSQITNEFQELGYNVTAKILLAAHYGVPQERWRLIVLGSRFAPLKHPAPSHYATAHANFQGGSSMTFQVQPQDRELLRPAVTVEDAINDLPRLEMGAGNEAMDYTGRPTSEYARVMRNPHGTVFNHCAAKLSVQNTERIRHVPPGGSWRNIPTSLLPPSMRRACRSSHTKRYGRLNASGLAGTIMTKCDPHWGAVVLPDQNRTLTVREAARLQSFPDTYRFSGSRVAQYRQVGNAVPVLMAEAIAEEIRTHLGLFVQTK